MVPASENLRPWPHWGGGARLSLSQSSSSAAITMIEVTAEALAAHPFLHGMSRDHLAVLAEGAPPIPCSAMRSPGDSRTWSCSKSWHQAGFQGGSGHPFLIHD